MHSTFPGLLANKLLLMLGPLQDSLRYKNTGAVRVTALRDAVTTAPIPEWQFPRQPIFGGATLGHQRPRDG